MRVYEAKLHYELIQFGEVERVDTPEKVVAYLQSAINTHPVQEGFYLILLDRKNHPIGRILITLGTLTSSLVHPREVFRPAMIAAAAAVIVAHNHPSGDPSPSSADTQVTRQLREASRIVDIDLIDHVIVGSKESDPSKVGYYSFKNAGFL